jgi:hypothetical protein
VLFVLPNLSDSFGLGGATTTGCGATGICRSSAGAGAGAGVGTGAGTDIGAGGGGGGAAVTRGRRGFVRYLLDWKKCSRP